MVGNVLAVFPDTSPPVEEARDLGDRVLVRVRAEGSGITLERDIWQVADVRDGRVNSSEALEAKGLRE